MGAFTTAGVIQGILAATAVAGTAASIGMSYYGQKEQARNAAAIAQWNYQAQQQQNQVQLALAQRQAAFQEQAAMSQYQAGQNNAKALEDQARAVEARGREEARRQREEGARLLARQRGRYGKSGVALAVGTPLDVMAESTALIELGVQDVAYETDMESRGFRRRAELERYQAGFSLMDAGVARFEAAAAGVGYRLNNQRAELARLSGLSDAQGYRSAANATLLAGIGQMASSGYDFYRQGAFNIGQTTASTSTSTPNWRQNATSYAKG
jgi:hypothetical protein